MTYDEMRVVVLGFPSVEEGTSYGSPAFLVRGKFLTRLRDEDDSLVLMEIDFNEREMLMEADPETFHLTDHYRNYPAVLARLSRLDAETLGGFIERRWRKLAPKKVVKAWDERGNDTGTQ